MTSWGSAVSAVALCGGVCTVCVLFMIVSIPYADKAVTPMSELPSVTPMSELPSVTPGERIELLG